MTEEKSERKEPAKKGLHGWKAAVTVFGCGTLAAFGVFGAIVGVLSLLINTASSGISASQGGSSDAQAVVPEQSIKPRDSVGTGALDLCGGTIPQAQSFSATRVDSGGFYEDPGEGEYPRIIFDKCSWSVIPAGGRGSPWSLDFSYSSFVADQDGSGASGKAEADYEDRISSIENIRLASNSSGEAEVGDESRYVHGLSEAGSTVYVSVIRSGDTVYQMHFESSRDFSGGSLIPVSHFKNEQGALAEYIEVRLGIVGPG